MLSQYTGQNCPGLMLYYTKIKQANEPQLYFSLLNFIKFHTWETEIFSCWSCKEDLHYSVSKHGNEITLKVCKITWFLRKKWIKKMKGCCVKNIATFLWMFWKAVNRKTRRKCKDSLQLIWSLSSEYGCLKTLLATRSVFSFEDGGLLLVLHTSLKMLLC